jgi:hypothetical protein
MIRQAAIRVRTEELDYSDIPDVDFYWSKTIYRDLKYLNPDDAPEPLGNYVTMSHYADAILMHDVMRCKAVTDILHLMNATSLELQLKQPLMALSLLQHKLVLNR